MVYEDRHGFLTFESSVYKEIKFSQNVERIYIFYFLKTNFGSFTARVRSDKVYTSIKIKSNFNFHVIEHPGSP